MLARSKREQKEEAQHSSKLASELLALWSWGGMSAPLVQKLAAAAHSDGLMHPEIVKISNIGAAGKFPANMHRDLMLISGKMSTIHEVATTIPIRLKAKEGLSRADTNLQFLLPHKLFAYIYASMPSAFLSSLLGGDLANLDKFWEAMKDHPYVLRRPQLLHRSDLKKVVPIAIHGDGVGYMRTRGAGGKSLDVLSWSSLLSHGATKVCSFLMFLVVKSVTRDTGFEQSWPKVWRILCWSLQALAAGTWPMKNWEGKDFDESSFDFKLKGTPLAEGYAAIVFVLRSDLEYLANHFGLHSPSSNTPCCLCCADRQMDSLPWTDVRQSAKWRATTWDPVKWAQENPACHPLLRMPGSGLDIVFPDLMHCKHLGTDQLLLGGVLTWLVKHLLPESMKESPAFVWHLIQVWYKDYNTRLARGIAH